MNHFAALSDLFDHLLSYELVQSVVEKQKYAEVSRKFSVRDLLDFLMASSLEKWDRYSDGADRMASLSLRPVHYSTTSKKAAALGAFSQQALQRQTSRCIHTGSRAMFGHTDQGKHLVKLTPIRSSA